MRKKPPCAPSGFVMIGILLFERQVANERQVAKEEARHEGERLKSKINMLEQETAAKKDHAERNPLELRALEDSVESQKRDIKRLKPRAATLEPTTVPIWTISYQYVYKCTNINPKHGHYIVIALYCGDIRAMLSLHKASKFVFD